MTFENNAIGLFDKMIYLNGSNVSREHILAQLDGIAMMDGEARDQAIGEYCLALYREVYRDTLKYRERAGNDLSLLKKGQELRGMNASDVLGQLLEAMGAYFKEKDIKVCEGKLYFGLAPEAIRDTVFGVGNEFKAIDTYRTSGREQTIALLHEGADALENLVGHNKKYDPIARITTDAVIEQMYIVYEERAAQYAERSFFWKLFHPIQAIGTSRFLTRVANALEKLGFDAAQHGDAVKERLANEPSSIIKAQMEKIKDDCKDMQNAIERAEFRKNNPELTVARDKFEKAAAFYEDKAHPFKDKVNHIIGKYPLPNYKAEEFTKVELSFRLFANDFDVERKTIGIEGHRDLKFINMCRAFVDAKLDKGEAVDIKEIFRDVHEYMVTEFQTFSLLYEREELKDIAKAGMLPQGTKLDFLQKKVIDAVEKKCGADEAERIKNDMQEIIDDFKNNREAYYEKEMQMLTGVENTKEQITVVLDDQVKDVEISEPVKEAPAVSKDNVQKV